MSEARRSSHLAPPFAIAGAAGGWLSAGLVANPAVYGAESVQGGAALVAMGFGAAIGALLTRWGGRRRRRYLYELDDEVEAAGQHPPGDQWYLHVPAVLVAGTAAGATIAALFGVYNGVQIGALGGLLCALAFVPVCVAVTLAARRARRARLGSIVAGSDRRAVWGILATTIALVSLEAAIDWPASAVLDTHAPWPAIGILAAAGLMIAAILAADVRALRRAREVAGQGLVAREPAEAHEEDAAVPKVDFGLGDGVAARVARSAAAYRGRDRTLALVQGSPAQAEEALRRAIRRGVWGLCVVVATACIHGAARTPAAGVLYDDVRCERYDTAACERLAERARDLRPRSAAELYERACRGLLTSSCVKAAWMYSDGEGVVRDQARAAYFHERACAGGFAPSCRAAALLRASDEVR